MDENVDMGLADEPTSSGPWHSFLQGLSRPERPCHISWIPRPQYLLIEHLDYMAYSVPSANQPSTSHPMGFLARRFEKMPETGLEYGSDGREGMCPALTSDLNFTVRDPV